MTKRRLDEFRGSVPVLEHLVWLNTPAAAPATTPVLRALRRTLDEWEGGTFSWLEWESTGYSTRPLFARLIGASPDCVGLVSSVAEAAATVASSLPAGRIVAGAIEFKDNLFPWLSLRQRGFEIVEVPATEGVVRTEDMLSHISADTVLVAVSEVLSCNGNRADLQALAARCAEVGARLFVDATQSLGALHLDAPSLGVDFVAAHGYKWLLGSRGCAWLYVRSDRLPELSPLAPNWKSVTDPYAAYFGGPLELAATTRKLDSSISWLPWIGARAALELLLSFDRYEVEARALGLAEKFREAARRAGRPPLAVETPSHIVLIPIDDRTEIEQRLASSNVVAAFVGPALRLGFHAFNDDGDVEAALRVVS